ncbi:hypothetical protein FNAPI_4697 [Fusarium napiforme]|uniref:Uncharacterized protein n=1 Tax=Fusarium napiforme TaxID=42672 RepID=A0A8H5NC65_9HYPO|nr:hypothetical protein FNAPI_4697 [Fusarium napiforme]
MEPDENDLSEDDEEPQVLPRCGLCRFKFEPADSIVVFHPMFPIWEGKYSEEPTGSSPPEEGFHSACVAQFSKPLRNGTPVNPFADSDIWMATYHGKSRYSTAYDEPPPSFEVNRLRRLKKMFAQELMTITGGRLPLEVCENIAQYCLSDYATRLLKEAREKRGDPGPRNAKLHVKDSGVVWAQHVEFEGIQYIKSLSTSRKNESDTKLFDPRGGTHVNIYFAEDLLGIREVVMTRDDNTVLTQGENLSWVVNRGVALPFWFTIESDGLKLRDLAIAKIENEVTSNLQRRWAVLPSHLQNCQFAPPPKDYHRVGTEPVRAVDWNLPGCRGYSILIDTGYICDIIPNNGRGSSSQLMDVNNKHEGAWVYIPIDPGERIIELWRRHCDYPWRLFKSLVIRTNKGRSFVIGSHLGLHSTSEWICQLTYHAIAELPPNEPSRMLYCETRNARLWLSFEQAATRDQNADISFMKPFKLTAFPGSNFISSTAKLQDVRTISVCRSYREGLDISCGEPIDEGIVGLLLTYEDGRQRSIGQIRLDHMGAPLMVNSGKFWLGSDKSEEEPLPGGFWPRTQTIKCVEVDKPSRDQDREYLKVPLTGSLEWQSYKKGDYYRHLVFHHKSNGLEDNADEMDALLACEAEFGERASAVVEQFSLEF